MLSWADIQNNPDFDFFLSLELSPDHFSIPTIFMILLKLPDTLINFNFPALKLKNILNRLIFTINKLNK